MIIEWLVSVGTGIAGWFGSLFSSWTVPDWATTTLNGTHDFLLAASGLGAWFPWAVVSAVVGSLVIAYGVAFGIKLTRAIAAHIPQFGGAG